MSEASAAFHEQVVKPIARFLRDYPGDLNDALALRVCFASALVHEDQLAGNRNRMNDYLSAMRGAEAKEARDG